MRESPPNRQTGGSMGDRPSVMDEMRSVQAVHSSNRTLLLPVGRARWNCNKAPIRYWVHCWILEGNWIMGRDVHVFITGQEGNGN